MKELTREQEEYLWQLQNIKYPTIEERNNENLEFLKGLYYDLELHFLKKLDIKNAKFFQDSYKEVEALFLGKPVYSEKRIII
jgi:hypothetical protein